jgi:putative transcriptional regulator
MLKHMTSMLVDIHGQQTNFARVQEHLTRRRIMQQVMRMIRCRLRQVLEERGLRQDWLANRAGIHNATLSRLVTGKTVPTMEVAYRIASALDLHVDEIWVWEDDGS